MSMPAPPMPPRSTWWRAIWLFARPLSRTSRTASRRNSGGYGGRVAGTVACPPALRRAGDRACLPRRARRRRRAGRPQAGPRRAGHTRPRISAASCALVRSRPRGRRCWMRAACGSFATVLRRLREALPDQVDDEGCSRTSASALSSTSPCGAASTVTGRSSARSPSTRASKPRTSERPKRAADQRSRDLDPRPDATDRGDLGVVEERDRLAMALLIEKVGAGRWRNRGRRHVSAVDNRARGHRAADRLRAARAAAANER